MAKINMMKSDGNGNGNGELTPAERAALEKNRQDAIKQQQDFTKGSENWNTWDRVIGEMNRKLYPKAKEIVEKGKKAQSGIIAEQQKEQEERVKQYQESEKKPFKRETDTSIDYGDEDLKIKDPSLRRVNIKDIKEFKESYPQVRHFSAARTKEGDVEFKDMKGNILDVKDKNRLKSMKAFHDENKEVSARISAGEKLKDIMNEKNWGKEREIAYNQYKDQY